MNFDTEIVFPVPGVRRSGIMPALWGELGVAVGRSRYLKPATDIAKLADNSSAAATFIFPKIQI